MTIQDTCDICEESWPENSLVLVGRYNKTMCPECINDLVDDLEQQIDNLRAVETAIELYNQERRR